LGDKYKTVMDKIELTDEARERILNNIKKKSGVLTFVKRTRQLGIAACMALILAVGITAVRMYAPNDAIVVSPYIEEATSVTELSEILGFDMDDVPELPFEAKSAAYCAMDNMGEITYEGEGESAVYRKSKGEEDNSGDYTDYENICVIEADGVTVTLKGDDKYTLAIWHDGEYSYSLSLSSGLTSEQWQGKFIKGTTD